MTTLQNEWLEKKIKYIKGLKSPSEQQQLLVLLAEKPAPSPADKKALNAIIKAEKAAERAVKASTEAASLIQSEKKARQEAARRARTHELCKSAGLLGLAGLVDTETGKPTIEPAELLGALIGLASVPADHPKRAEWRQIGAERLKKAE